MRHLSIFTGLLCALSVMPAAAMDVPSPEVRLLVAGPTESPGRYRAGLSVDLPEGWHTYWRSPGDAGVPPVFAVTASSNLADMAVRFPAPTRYFDGYGTSIVYHERVLLPVDLVAADPAAPVSATIRFDYGYCREICVPATAELTFAAGPGDAVDLAADSAIAAARARVPVPEAEAAASAPAVLETRRTGADLLEIVVDPKGAPGVDLFAEGPADWYLSPPERIEEADGRLRFRLTLDGRPKDSVTAGAEITLTISAGLNSVTLTRRLD